MLFQKLEAKTRFDCLDQDLGLLIFPKSEKSNQAKGSWAPPDSFAALAFGRLKRYPRARLTGLPVFLQRADAAEEALVEELQQLQGRLVHRGTWAARAHEGHVYYRRVVVARVLPGTRNLGHILWIHTRLFKNFHCGTNSQNSKNMSAYKFSSGKYCSLV